MSDLDPPNRREVCFDFGSTEWVNWSSPESLPSLLHEHDSTVELVIYHRAG